MAKKITKKGGAFPTAFAFYNARLWVYYHMSVVPKHMSTSGGA
jgi:hypothetical protein